MAKIQKPNPKNIVTIGRLKQIIANNEYDKNNIEQIRKAVGTDMSNADQKDIEDQIRLDQIENQNMRYGKMVKNPKAFQPKSVTKAIVVKKFK